MALPVTSGTASFLVTRDDVITEAFSALKVIPEDGTPNATQLTKGQLNLNMILKELNTLGVMKWVYQSINFALAANKTSYTISEISADVTAFNPFEIAHAFTTDTSTTPNQDQPLIILPQADWDMLTPKVLATGRPTQGLWQYQLTSSIFKPWPQPLDASFTCTLVAQRPIQDITGATQNFDVSQEAFRLLKWLLADELCMSYETSVEVQDRVTARAEKLRARITDALQEQGSINFGIDMSGMGSPFGM